MKLDALVVAAGLCVMPVTSWAAEPCGGADLQQGVVKTGKVMTVEWLDTPDGKACLAHIAKTVDKNRLVRAVTVAVRVPDAQRGDGKALTNAKSIADTLVAAGLPRNRVFALAPRAEDSEPASVQIRYTERAPENVLARIASLGGTVKLGPDEDNLKPAEEGMPVLVNEVIQTGANGTALVRLKDGSGIKLGSNGLLKVAQLEISDTNERQVRIEVLRGAIETDVKKAAANSRFEASTKVAVASVRGTGFRFGTNDDGTTKLETLEGRVALGSATDRSKPPVEVAAGQGARVSATGTVEAPRSLLKAATVLAPLKGALPANKTFSWTAVDGAVSYQVDIARDADFTVALESRTSKTASLVLADAPGDGKWFWRVTPKDDAGFVGTPSKIYVFHATP